MAAERHNERRPGRVASVVAVLDDAARARVSAVDEEDAAAADARDRHEVAVDVEDRHRAPAHTRQSGAERHRTALRRLLGQAVLRVVVLGGQVLLLVVVMDVALLPRGVKGELREDAARQRAAHEELDEAKVPQTALL